MITVTIYRKTLTSRDACTSGLALYDQIAALLPESDARRGRRIRIAKWTPLQSIPADAWHQWREAWRSWVGR